MRYDKKIYIGPHVKYRLFLSDFKKTSNFLDIFSKNTRIPNFKKICPVEVELFRADDRTDGET